MMTVLKTLIGVLVVIIIATLAFIYSGVYNVAADELHTAPIRWILETVRTQSIDRRDNNIQVPDDLTNMQRIQGGARSYAAMCQICHLGPGIEPTPLHIGLNPQPPRLSKEADHHSAENLFWITKHGIKMTGMPAWGETHTDEELWDIVAFIKKLPELSPEQYKKLTNDANPPPDAGHSHGKGKFPHSH
jgi:mono/diheme cytochrome c family protein